MIIFLFVGFGVDALCRLKSCPFSLSKKRRTGQDVSKLFKIKSEESDDSRLQHSNIKKKQNEKISSGTFKLLMTQYSTDKNNLLSPIDKNDFCRSRVETAYFFSFFRCSELDFWKVSSYKEK
jgi:hypothetical protein